MSHGALYKCTMPDGSVGFQGTPCQFEATESTISTDYTGRGFLKKWFKIPPTSSQVKCDDKFCLCGNEKVHTGWWRPEAAVPKMVEGLLSSWQSYENLPEGSSREERRRAVCRIRIHQEAFNISYEKFSKESQDSKKGLKKAQESKESCQEERDNKKEEKIKRLMSPPYSQSRRLAERNSAYAQHLGNPCNRSFDGAVAKLPQRLNVNSTTTDDAYASIERLK